MPGFSQRLGRVSLAASVQMTIKARELKAAGKPVVTLTTGEPNFDSPPHAIEAAHQAALAGDTKYPPQDGTRALKLAIQAKFKRDSGLDYALDEIGVGQRREVVRTGDARAGQHQIRRAATFQCTCHSNGHRDAIGHVDGMTMDGGGAQATQPVGTLFQHFGAARQQAESPA